MPAEVICVAMYKGGVGKTSLISNLAGAITTKLKKKVLIVDLDGQGNLGLSFGLFPENLHPSIYNVLLNESTLKKATYRINKHLHIIPANSDMNFVEFEILPKLHEYPSPFELLKNSLKEVINDYDYIFLDTPPSLGLIVGNALVASDKVVIPYVPEVFAVNGLIRIYKEITDFKNVHNPKLKVAGIVGMMTDLRTTLHQDMLQQARIHCYENNIPMFDTVIPRSIRFSTSNVIGKPAVWIKSNKDSHLVNTYFELLNEIIERDVINV